MKQYTVFQVTPEEYKHSRAFDEIALSFKDSLLELGYDCKHAVSVDEIEGTPIVFGANLLGSEAKYLSEDTIIFNLEQISPESPWMKGQYPELLKRFRVWDYSPQNIKELKRLNICNVNYCGIGYNKTLEHEMHIESKDIDVLFYGSLNERRIKILNELARQGVRVKHLYDVYGAERDKYIARSKIVLNVHYYEASIFEIIRVSYLFANKQFVITEAGNDLEMEMKFRKGAVFCNYKDLVAACLHFLHRDAERKQIAEKGYEVFKEVSQRDYIQRILHGNDHSDLNQDRKYGK